MRVFATKLAKTNKFSKEICAVMFPKAYSILNKLIPNELIMQVKYEKGIHEYVTDEVDKVWCMDFTNINKEAYVFVVMDLATKRILGHYIFKNLANPSHLKASSQEVITILEDFMQHYETKPLQVMTDRGGQFVSKEFKAWVQKHGIIHETNSNKFQNQVIERWNLTFKNNLIKYLQQKQIQIMGDNIHAIVQQIIDTYNDTIHRTLGATPNFAEKALVLLKTEQNITPIKTMEGIEEGFEMQFN